MKRTVAVKDEAACPSEPEAKRAKAEEDAEADSILELDASEFECVVCYDLLVDPVVGKCGHDFCKACLEDWRHKQHTGIAAGLGLRTTCPVCRKDVGLDNSAAHRQPDELGVCIRLKELIERLFPKRSKERRREVEAEEEERKQRRELERQEQQRQAELRAQLRTQRQEAERDMQQVWSRMRFSNGAPGSASMGAADRAAFMSQMMRERLDMVAELAQTPRVLRRGNAAANAGAAHGSNVDRGAVGDAADAMQQQLRRSERLRGTAANPAAATRAELTRQAAAPRELPDDMVPGVRARRAERRQVPMEVSELWTYFGERTELGHAQAGARTLVQRTGAEPPAVGLAAGLAAAEAREDAAAVGSVAAAPQERLESSAGQPARAADPDQELRMAPAALRHRIGTGVAAEAAAVARQRLLLTQLQQHEQRLQQAEQLVRDSMRQVFRGHFQAREAARRQRQRQQPADLEGNGQQQQQALHPADVNPGHGADDDVVPASATAAPAQQAAAAHLLQAADLHRPDMPGLLLNPPNDDAALSDDVSALLDALYDDHIADGRAAQPPAGIGQQEQRVQDPAGIVDAPPPRAAAAAARYTGARQGAAAAGTAATRNQGQALRAFLGLNPAPSAWGARAQGTHSAVLDAAEAEVPADVLLQRSRAIAAAGARTAAQQRMRLAVRRLNSHAAAEGDAATTVALARGEESARPLGPDDPLADTAGSSHAATAAAATAAGRDRRTTAMAATAAAAASGGRSIAAPPPQPAVAGDAGIDREQVGSEAPAPAPRREPLGFDFMEGLVSRQQSNRNQAAAGRRHSTADEECWDALHRSGPTLRVPRWQVGRRRTGTTGLQSALGEERSSPVEPLEDLVAAAPIEADAAEMLDVDLQPAGLGALPASATQAAGQTAEWMDAATEAARRNLPRRHERVLGSRVAASAARGASGAAPAAPEAQAEGDAAEFLDAAGDAVEHNVQRGRRQLLGSNAAEAAAPAAEAAAPAAEAEAEGGIPDPATEPARRTAARRFVQMLCPPAAASTDSEAAPAAAVATGGAAAAPIRNSASDAAPFAGTPAAAVAAAAAATAEGSGRVRTASVAGRSQQAALHPAASGDLAREVARETSTAVARAVARQIRREVLPQLRSSAAPPVVVDGGYISSDSDDA